MTAPIIDRDAIIEKAARKSFVDANGASGIDWEDVDQRGWIADAASMLPSIADGLLAPIEALMVGRDDWVHPIVHLSELRQAVAAIREAVGA